jgi:probable phosphoglycerate mutase
MIVTPRRLLVWRHGETSYNASRRWQGQLDIPLSDVGREQAAHAAKMLASSKFSRIVASDLQRAAETARALADESGARLTLDPRFREIDTGQWSGLTADEVRERFGESLRRLDAGEDLPRGETGETVAQVAARVTAAVQDVIAGMAPGETVVLVGHGFSGRVLCASLAGIPQEIALASFRGMDNCHWAELVEHGDIWRIAGWNLS